MIRRTQRPNRPYTRVRRPEPNGGGVAKTAARLASLAGGTDRPALEALEKRQMLFSLSVSADDVDPNTGIGTVQAVFGYYLPILGPTAAIEDAADPETRTEDFNQLALGPVQSGAFLGQSGIRVRHSIPVAGNIRVANLTNDATDQERWMRVAFTNANQSVTFTLFNDGTNPTFPLPASGVGFRIDPDVLGDSTGLETDNLRVVLIRGTTTVRTYTGAEVRQAINGATLNNPALGIGDYAFPLAGENLRFDTVRIEMINPPSGTRPEFRLDNISFTVPNDPRTEVLRSATRGAVLSITGPVGATANVLDLFGRDMRAEIALVVGESINIEPGTNGGNYGIGQIRLSGTDSRTSFTLMGLELQEAQEAPAGSVFFDSLFGVAALLPTTLPGNNDTLAEAGFGFFAFPNQNAPGFTFGGVPPAAGTVVVGSPWVRDQDQFTVAGLRQLADGVVGSVVQGNYTRTDQGIFTTDDQPVGSVYIDGIMFGSSRFGNFVDRLYVGYLLGSVNVAGDLGSLTVGTDAGMFAPEQTILTNVGGYATYKTGSQIVVGRTLGEVTIGGRSLMDITVVGNLSSPSTAPARDVFTYYEREVSYATDPAIQDPIRVMRRRILNDTSSGDVASGIFRSDDGQAEIVGGAFRRNDSILQAEFIGSASSGVRVKGALSGRDPVNTGEDKGDVYAFAADGTQEIVIDVTGAVGNLRIMDQEGRTLAAPQLEVGRRSTPFTGQLRYKPTGPGIYYIALTDGNLNDPDTAVGNAVYSFTVTGMAAVTFGSLRQGAGGGVATGTTDAGVSGSTASITVLNGDVGLWRWGAGIMVGAGTEADPTAAFNRDTNTQHDVDAAMTLEGGNYTTVGSIFGIIAGADLGAGFGATGSGITTIVAGGNIGTIFTGLSGVAGRGPNEGDVLQTTIRAGGSIAGIGIQGGIGMDQDRTDNPLAQDGPNTINILTGLSGGRGDIGYIRSGFHVGGDTLSVVTSPGSTIGALLVSQDAYVLPERGDQVQDPRYGIYQGTRGLPITTGLGSDVRFVDAPRLDLQNTIDASSPLTDGNIVTLVDDGGAQVNISVGGGGGTGAVLGRVISFPIDGSQGRAIAAIIVDLSGGQTLDIQGFNPGGSSGTVGIGRIVIVGAAAGSAINIGGNVQVDIYRIEADQPLTQIVNDTPGGDIVAIDAAGLGTLSIPRGNLGYTQVPAWSDSRIGPQLGVRGALQGQVGAPMGFAVADAAGGRRTIDTDFAGGARIFRAIRDDNPAAGNASLDDVGGPMDGQLNGLVVRTGDVATVEVGGRLGDVILQGGTATLGSVRADLDGLRAPGSFDGIEGSLYAANIAFVDVGAGLRKSDGGPLVTSGIFAFNDIGQITSNRPGAVISAPIIAANSGAVNIDGRPEGIQDITINNGLFIDAWVSSTNMDNFWNSVLYGDDNFNLGDINQFSGSGTNVFRSNLGGSNLINMTLGNGYLDAVTLRFAGNIQTISVTGIRNSTVTGTTLEARRNEIIGGGNLQNLTVTEDISDLVVDILGDANSISARNILRSTIDVDNRIESLAVSRSIRSTNFSTGSLVNANISQKIVSSAFQISGLLQSLRAGDSIENSSVSVSGPDATIQNITALNLISGTIEASGPINLITATAGDIAATIRTTTERGNVTALRAGRDLAITTDISGNMRELTAGRHIGTAGEKGVILVRGDFANARATAGQLYSDIRAGGSITGTIDIARVVSKPGNDQLGTGSIVAFGSIATVNVAGDFGGDIISYSGGIGTVAITNGSFLPGRTISAFTGDLNSLTITNGNLLGNLYADFDLKNVRVTASGDGVFGDVGINPASSAFVSYDAFRNQLPVGVGANSTLQGPTIQAGRNIVAFNVSNGSIFESVFHAGGSIQNVTVTGAVGGDGLSAGIASVFAAGDSIDTVTINGSASDAMFAAGVVSLGADNRPGGLGSNADVIKSGNIQRVSVTGAASRSLFTAGVTAGLDGSYNTGDDQVVLGSSNISTLTLGSVSQVTVLADSFSKSVSDDNRFAKSSGLAVADALVDNGVGSPGTGFTGTQSFSFQGGTVTLALSGTGQGFFDSATGRVTLRGTTTGSSLTVTSSLVTLSGFDIVTSDDASLSTLRVTPILAGGSDIVIDGGVSTLDLTTFGSTGRISVGGDVNSARFAAFTSGTFSARALNALTITGGFGNADALVTGEASVQALTAGTIALGGGARGNISIDRNASAINVTGATDHANIRVGRALAAFSTGDLLSSVVSAGESIGTAAIAGSMGDSTISAGVDLGRDAFFGGADLNADTPRTGRIGSVTITRDLIESNIVAGYNRGKDAFFGSNDDTVAPGLSTIDSVNVQGTARGSTRLSENYRIASSGSLGTVIIGGTGFSGIPTNSNFGTEAQRGVLLPAPVVVNDIRVTSSGGVFSSDIVFSQPIDASTLPTSLSISEVRGANVLIRLIEGVDYVISGYNAQTATATILFNRNLTNANLPTVPTTPSPGIYRFSIDPVAFRGKSLGSTIDGDGDGFSQPGDAFQQNTIVGDAGDKLISESPTATAPNVPAQRIDFYAPINLDTVFDSTRNPDTLPDVNTLFTVRGSIGDHPDNNVNTFSFSSDSDLYQITLQAGQILQLGALQGSASLAQLFVLGPDGERLEDANIQAQFGLLTAANAQKLPADFANILQTASDLAYLVKTTGVYTIVVGNSASFDQPGEIPNVAAVSGGQGLYSFTARVFDDGDSGFTNAVDAGNGSSVVDAPRPIAFAGFDQVFGTSDDVSTIQLQGFTFTIEPGADGRAGLDDVVSGVNRDGTIRSTRVGETVTNTVSAAIGLPGNAGVPNRVFADVDVFHLNGRTPIAPGTRMKITIKLSESGADLGSASQVGRNGANEFLAPDQRGAAQFALFDTTDSTSIDDALLVFSPTDFSPNGGTPNTLIASNGSTAYGYDANGDFYIDFVVPERAGFAGQAGTFAAYLQGAFNTDYKLEVVTDGSTGAVTRQRQNFLIETQGGSVDWLEAGGLTTALSPFTARTLGFTGFVNGTQTADQYVLSRLISSLNTLFQTNSAPGGGGFDVNFSTDPAAFENQRFSTIYLSSTADALTILFDRFDFGTPGSQPREGFASTQPYGFSQHSDPFNTDLEDEAVVFAPSFGLLGFTPSTSDLDLFVKSLSAAVGRRAGELMGLRINEPNAVSTITATGFDPFASNSVNAIPGVGFNYNIPNASRPLSRPLDPITRTDFFLGSQNSSSLLDKVLGRI